MDEPSYPRISGLHFSERLRISGLSGASYPRISGLSGTHKRSMHHASKPIRARLVAIPL